MRTKDTCVPALELDRVPVHRMPNYRIIHRHRQWPLVVEFCRFVKRRTAFGQAEGTQRVYIHRAYSVDGHQNMVVATEVASGTHATGSGKALGREAHRTLAILDIVALYFIASASLPPLNPINVERLAYLLGFSVERLADLSAWAARWKALAIFGFGLSFSAPVLKMALKLLKWNGPALSRT